jgi:hypothetical protein
MDTQSGYRERCRVQCLSWAMGRPYHNRVDDECCSDFSCCVADMFEHDQAKRWEHYHKRYGRTA